MSMSEEQMLIWAAGFFDGEGCVSIHRGKNQSNFEYHALDLKVFQNERTPLEVLHALFGGSIRRRDDGWLWEAAGAATIPALEKMCPYLIVKRAQAEVALLFQKRKAPKGGKYKNPIEAKRLDAVDFQKVRELKRLKGEQS